MSQAFLYESLQSLTMTVLVLLNMKTHVPLGERFAESCRAWDTLKMSWSMRRDILAHTGLEILIFLSTIASILGFLLLV